MLLRRLVAPVCLSAAALAGASVAARQSSYLSNLLFPDNAEYSVDMPLADIPDTLSDGTPVKMGKFLGNVLYITNVASQ